MRFNLFVAAIICVAGNLASAEDKLKQVPLKPQMSTYDLEPYRYVLLHVISNDGSLTRVGSLFLDGRPIAGADFYRLELPIGSFIWHPSKPSEHSSSHLVGWIRIDPTKKYSRWSMALIETDPAPDAKFLRTTMRTPIPPKKVEVETFRDPLQVQ